MVFSSSASKAGPCTLSAYSFCLLSQLVGEAGGERRGEEWGGKGRRVGEEGRRGDVLQHFPLFPEPLSRHIKFLPSLPGCPALALGINLVYTAHYARFAVAIATTRGQFIEEEEVHFWGVSFPAPVQSTAENKDPDTQGGNTWKSLLRAEASFRASHCHQQSFFFAVKAVLEPPIGA